jgi:hypothetical protein
MGGVGCIGESALALVVLEVRFGFWLKGGVDRRMRVGLVGCEGGGRIKNMLMYKGIFD